MKIITSTLLFWSLSFVINHLALSAQTAGFNYVPLVFDSLEPFWVHMTYDSSIVNHTIVDQSFIEFDGYSHVTPDENFDYHIKDDFIYSVKKTVYNNDLGGGILEKIDLDSGESIWKNVFDQRTAARKEYIYTSQLEGDNLVLYNLEVEEIDPPGPIVLLGGAVGYLKKRIYNLESGQLVLNSVPDTLNESLLKISASRRKVGDMSILSDSLILVTSLVNPPGDSIFLTIDSINHQGSKLNPSDTLFFGEDNEIDLDRRRHSLAEDVESNHYICRSTTFFENGSRFFELEMIKIETDGRSSTRKFPSESNDSIILALVEDVSDEVITVVFHYEASRTYSTYNKQSLDLIEDQKEMPYLSRFHNMVQSEGIHFDDTEVENNGILESYVFSADTLDLASSFRMNVPDYGLVVRNYKTLDDGDILIGLRYNGYNSGGFPLGFFTAMLRVSPESTGLTSVDQLSEVEAKYNIFPNPSTDIVKVELPEGGNFHVSLYDMQGKRHHQSHFTSGGMKRISTSGLPAGNYLLRIWDGHSFSSQLIQKID